MPISEVGNRLDHIAEKADDVLTYGGVALRTAGAVPSPASPFLLAGSKVVDAAGGAVDTWQAYRAYRRGDKGAVAKELTEAGVSLAGGKGLEKLGGRASVRALGSVLPTKETMRDRGHGGNAQAQDNPWMEDIVNRPNGGSR